MKQAQPDRGSQLRSAAASQRHPPLEAAFVFFETISSACGSVQSPSLHNLDELSREIVDEVKTSDGNHRGSPAGKTSFTLFRSQKLTIRVAETSSTFCES
jgi:hypothetical protein